MRISEQISRILPMQTQEALADYQKALPKITIGYAEEQLREISPIFLGELPFNPSDPFLKKCLDTVIAVLSLASYVRSETRALIRFQPLAKEVKATLKVEIDRVAEQVCKSYFHQEEAVFMIEFFQEKLKVAQGEQDKVPKTELMDKFIESFEVLMKARSNIYLGGERHSLKDKGIQAKLIEMRKQYFEDLYSELESYGDHTVENSQMRLDLARSLFEFRFDQNIELTHELNNLHEFLATPFRYLG